MTVGRLVNTMSAHEFLHWKTLYTMEARELKKKREKQDAKAKAKGPRRGRSPRRGRRH